MPCERFNGSFNSGRVISNHSSQKMCNELKKFNDRDVQRFSFLGGFFRLCSPLEEIAGDGFFCIIHLEIVTFNPSKLSSSGIR